MSDERKKIIVTEIERWRRSKLLPEHYCDFLMNLYMDEHTERPKEVLGVSADKIAGASAKLWIAVIAGIGLFCYVLLNFVSFPVYAQLGIGALFVGGLYVLGARSRDTSPIHALAYNGAASVLLLAFGMLLLHLHGKLGEPTYVIGYLLCSSIIWIVTGIAFSMAIFHLCGWIGVAFTYAWLLHTYVGSVDWAVVELSWIPISLLFGWLGWLLHYREKAIGVVLLMMCGIVWLMPELYMMAVTNWPNELAQLLLFGKLAAAGLVLFLSRKKWIEWVA